ncbi:SDR family oxidoreductase [Streptomyces sp. CAU 1734]|uniref:SDR family NAD(P)-dependent oxidoreductase n=1 Tax=Streptomyces sp. CAU 1734 TaxID=3140360 RepID=UPI003260EA66
MNLSTQIAIVTGGGRGIGRQIALSLARAGARVAVVARSRADLEETAELAGADRARILVAPADMTDPEAVREMTGQVRGHFGPVTLLVNNAAVYTPGEGPLWEADLDAWWRHFETNVRGPLICVRAVLPSMVAAGSGRIISVGSDSGPLVFPLSSYNFAKNALVRLTETLDLALEEAGTGVRSFVVSPGVVRTRMTESFAARHPDMEWNSPDECGRLVTALASGRYDALHGRYLSIRDDLDLLLKRIDEIRDGELLVQRMRVYGPDGTVTTNWE